MHSDFLDISRSRVLARPGDLSVLGTDIDLSAFRKDAYLIAGLTDHITPWHACYRTTHVLGGKMEFVLVGSGHIQTLTSAPGNPKARYFRNDTLPATAEEWLASQMACSRASPRTASASGCGQSESLPRSSASISDTPW